jgi:hypothetical protein
MVTINRDAERHDRRMRVSFSGNDALYPLPPDERIAISSYEDFLKIGTEFPSNGNFYLTQNIDLSNRGYVEYVPISLINGKFDGAGHTISGLTASKTEYDGADFYMGLFKDLNYSLVKNLTIANFDMTCLIAAPLAATINGSIFENCNTVGCHVRAGGYGGALFALGSLNTLSRCNITDATVRANAAVAFGVLTDTVNVFDCHVIDSTIIGTGAISGFIGLLDKGGRLESCSTNADLFFDEEGDVDDFQYAAGLIIASQIGVSVINCFSDCSWHNIPETGVLGSLVAFADYGTYVENSYGVSHGANIGLVGFVGDATFVDSFWDITVSDQTSSAGGTGKTTAEMQTCSTFSTWDIGGAWSCAEGAYPTLNEFTGYIDYIDVSDLEIASVGDFQKIGVETAYPNYRNYILTADLDLDGVDWTPIDLYNGQFNGNGHTIRNFVLDSSTSTGVALFSQANAVRGLTIEDSFVRGQMNVALISCGEGASGLIISDCTTLNSRIVAGILAGSITASFSTGQVDYCYSDSTVFCEAELNPQQHDYFGGLTGSGSAVRWSKFEGKLEGTEGTVANFIGGIGGQLSAARFCSVICDVTGHSNVGGIAGAAFDIDDCRHVGTVAGVLRFGGIIGSNHRSYGGWGAPSGWSIDLFRNYHSGDIINTYNSVGGGGPIIGSMYPGSFFSDVEHCYYNADSQIDSYFGSDPNFPFNGIPLSTEEMTCPTDSFEGFDFEEIWDCIVGQMPDFKEAFVTAPEFTGGSGDIYLLYPTNDGQQFRDFKPLQGNNWWFENVYIAFADELTEGEEVKLVYYEKNNGKYLIQEITEQAAFIQLPFPVQTGDRVVLTVTGPEGSEYQGPKYVGYVTYRK